MIDFTSIRQDMENYIRDNYSETAVAYENKFPDLADVSELIALKDTIVDSDKPMIGNPSQLMHGFLTVEIFTPLGIGTNRSRKIASILANLLISKTSGVIEFTESELHSVPTTDKSIYYQQNLHLPYVFTYGDVGISC